MLQVQLFVIYGWYLFFTANKQFRDSIRSLRVPATRELAYETLYTT